MKIQKAREIRNLKPSFVSLVKKPANRRSFVASKADDGGAQVTTEGIIVCAEEDSHLITGIVYEPLVEDAHGDYMTAAEIAKAAHWFAKNGNRVDLQHSCVGLSSAAVVENCIAKSNMELDDPFFGRISIRKGTWMVTVEIEDEELWGKITSREIGGFSLYGLGEFMKSEDSTDETEANPLEFSAKEETGFVRKFAHWLLKMSGESLPDEPSAQAAAKTKKETEENTMTEEQVTQIAKDAINTALPDALSKALGAALPEAISKAIEQATKTSAATPEPIEKTEPAADTETLIADAVSSAVAKAIAPIMKAAGLPTGLDGDNNQAAENHYLSGIL
ncbi:MAG: XkdF-like putative serine protease domain-containing protein [Oscillospiraceae bacterium]|jgi:hypothetical protein|nr:XkdF-like putative serine protease domain-containing protein [Oscillospiraceae bacterium]